MIKLIRISLILILSSIAHAHQHEPTAENPSPLQEVDSPIYPLKLIEGWGATQEGSLTPKMSSTHGGIVVGRDGTVYVSADQGIFAFSPAGKLLRQIEGNASGIHGMTIRVEDGTEYIYAARNNHAEVIKLQTDGTIALRIPFPEESGIQGKYKPTGVAIKPDGNILVADGYGTNMIFEFDPSGKYLSAFGGNSATDIEKFQRPHGISIDTRYTPARILIADREKKRLVHFELDGKFIGEVYTGLRRPCAVSIHDGKVAIAELQGRVTILDQDNQLLGHLGNNPNQEQWAKFKIPASDWQPGVFTAPHGLSWDAEGNLYVQDWNIEGRVSKWVPGK
ncbi:MAG: 6-bladed beta-propeller [Verrucomicrobiota bacterium]